MTEIKRIDELELGDYFNLYNVEYQLRLVDMECPQLFWISRNGNIFCAAGSCVVEILT